MSSSLRHQPLAPHCRHGSSPCQLYAVPSSFFSNLSKGGPECRQRQLPHPHCLPLPSLPSQLAAHHNSHNRFVGTRATLRPAVKWESPDEVWEREDREAREKAASLGAGKALEVGEEGKGSGGSEGSAAVPQEVAPPPMTEIERTLMIRIGLARSTARLDLTDCRLTEFPAEILELKDLEDLSLAGNCLTTLPDGIGALTQLKRLGLAGNWLTQVPDSIGQCVKLEGLWLHGNLLSEVPSSLSSLTTLKQFSLSGNQLTGLSEDLFQGMSQLQDFAIAGNSLSKVPDSISCASSLLKLSLNGNRLISIPSLKGLTSLKELWLQGNKLTSIDSLDGLKSLQELSLADNSLASLPPTLSLLTSLEKFWAYGNQLTTFPSASLPPLTALSNCWLEGNPLSGEAVKQLCVAVQSMPALKAIGLDVEQVRRAEGSEGLKTVGAKLKVGEVCGGPGPGYFKLAFSPLTPTVDSPSGELAIPTGKASLPKQDVLVVALGSAPGTPNWGGLLGRLYKAGTTPTEKAFDVLYLVDAQRQWYGGAAPNLPSPPASTPSASPSHSHLQGPQAHEMPSGFQGKEEGHSSPPLGSFPYYYDRLLKVTQQYKHVVLLGDSMGATGALLFSPLATSVLAFCPQVDLATSCMRPGTPQSSMALLRSRVMDALERAPPHSKIVALVGTWQHDLEQVNLLPTPKVTHSVYSLDSHRLALYLDGKGKLLPLLQEHVLRPLGAAPKVIRTSNIL